MKGSLHIDEFLGAVVARETDLRTGRRISHVFVSDAAITIAPSLEDKADTCQNAIDLAISFSLAIDVIDRTPKLAYSRPREGEVPGPADRLPEVAGGGAHFSEW
jgi:hypothetical protein